MKDSIGRRLTWMAATVFVALFLSASLSQAQPADDVNKLVAQYMQLHKEGRFREAIPIAEKVLAIRENELGPNRLAIATVLANLALLHASIGEFVKAEPLYKRSLSIREKVLGLDHPDTARTLNNLGNLYHDMGDYGKAEPFYERSVGICEKVLGSDHPDTALSLNSLAELYRDTGRYTKAEPLYKRCLAINEKALGPQHPNTASALNNLAGLYYAIGDYGKAEHLYKRSLAIKEKALGTDHPDTALALNNLAELYNKIGDYGKAEPLYKRFLAIKEKALGTDHPDIARTLNKLGFLYSRMGDYAKAEPFYQRSLAIREKVLGPDHPDTALALNNLAEVYRNTSHYAKAESLHKQSLAIKEKVLGPDHPDTALTLNNLGILYHNLGDYAKAEPFYQRSLAIREKVLGPDHPDIALVLNNIATLYDKMSDYKKAEPFYKRSLAIREKALGPDHPDIALALNNIATLYIKMGDYGTAEPLCKRSLGICEKALGPDHPDTARTLNNLALLYQDTGDYGKAEPLYRRSLAINEKTFGPDHPDTARSLNNLALFYHDMGDYGKVKPLYQRSLAIYEKSLGPEHTDTATVLNNLALLYSTMGDYTKAESLYRRSLAIHEKSLGPDHPDTARSLNNLALLYAATGRHAYSLPLTLRAQDIDGRLIDQVMGFTSEDQKMKFLATKESDLYGFLSLVSQYMRDDRDASEKALTVWLQRKGVVLEAQKRFQDALALSDDPKVMEKSQELARVRAQLSKLTFSGPGKEGPEAYQKKVTDLEANKERLEAELSRLSDIFAKARKTAKADTKQVESALPKANSLIDFVKLPIYNFKAKGTERKWLPPRYYAFILPAGRADNVSLIDLGDAGEIDRLIGEFKKNITNHHGDPEGKEASRISRRLHDLVFAPIRKEIKDIKDIYLSPDGNLNLIPFEILKGPDDRYLIEDYTFNYLGSGRDLLGFGMVKGNPSKPLVIGDPDYDLDETGVKSSLTRLGFTSLDKRSITMRSQDMSMKGFSPLPGTKEEVESITSLLGKRDTSLYTGKDSIEEVLMGYQSPKVLHLATHGFFLSDQDLLDEKRKTPYENPLVRSGIVLAGANRSMKTGTGEGIVTAEKILSLRLRGTDLVVLSACETGLGDIKSGEGVFGLRRAFTQAGAKGIVMSMWSVPDKETKELMVNFYTNILVKKMKRPEALRQAMLTELAEVKKRYGTTNPFFWGAFVYLGEP